MHRSSPRARCGCSCAQARRRSDGGQASGELDKGHSRPQGQTPAHRHPLSLPQSGRGREGGTSRSGAIRYVGAIRQRVDARGQRQADTRSRAEALDHRDPPEGHGSHGHRHPGRIARAQPDVLLDRTGPGCGAVEPGQRSARGDRRDLAGPICSAGHGAAAECRPRHHGAGALRQATRPARRGNQSQRQRHGPHRPALEPGEVLRQGAGARRRYLHPSARIHAGRTPGRPLLQQRDR